MVISMGRRRIKPVHAHIHTHTRWIMNNTFMTSLPKYLMKLISNWSGWAVWYLFVYYRYQCVRCTQLDIRNGKLSTQPRERERETEVKSVKWIAMKFPNVSIHTFYKFMLLIDIFFGKIRNYVDLQRTRGHKKETTKNSNKMLWPIVCGSIRSSFAFNMLM